MDSGLVEDHRSKGETRRRRIDLVLAVGALLLAAAGFYYEFLRGGSSEQLSMSFVNRVDVVPEQSGHARQHFQMEALIRNNSDHDIILRFVNFDFYPRKGTGMSLGGVQPVLSDRPITWTSGFTLAPGVGQLFYVNVPAAGMRRWVEPGSRAVIVAGTSDGRTFSSKPTTVFNYSISG